MENGVFARHPEIIVLTDSESDDDLELTPEPTPSESLDDLHSLSNNAGSPDYAAFLDTIPDVDVPPTQEAPRTLAVEVELLTEAECLQRVLNIFPNIAVDHVLKLIGDATAITSDWCELLIGQILDSGTYPKENDEQNKLKRKRESQDEDGIAEFEKGDQENDDPRYFQQAVQILQDEFREIPVRHIQTTLRRNNTLFKAFLILDQQLRNYNISDNPFSKVRVRTSKRTRTDGVSTDSASTNRTQGLLKELTAAQKKRDKDTAQRKKEEENRRAEEENLRMAQQNNDITECLCCFDEYPTNRMTFCDGPIAHFFCWGCARHYVEEEIGKSRCRPICFAGQDNCAASFSRQQLQIVLEEKLFERLERLQQQEDIYAAGLEDLEACPFCDFQAECPPVEIDREFRCQNPICSKTSCRLCQAETHIPLTCEEFKKDNKIAVKHAMEEAMSKALIRSCNRCKNPFIKESGCNKMACSRCGAIMCYVCGKDVKDYNHFSSKPGDNRCPLHENTEQRHESDVKKAEAEELARLRAEHPDMSEEELKVQFSDRVQKDEQARNRRAAAALGPQVFVQGADMLHHDLFIPLPIHPPPPMPNLQPQFLPQVQPVPPAFGFVQFLQNPFQNVFQNQQQQNPNQNAPNAQNAQNPNALQNYRQQPLQERTHGQYQALAQRIQQQRQQVQQWQEARDERVRQMNERMHERHEAMAERMRQLNERVQQHQGALNERMRQMNERFRRA